MRCGAGDPRPRSAAGGGGRCRRRARGGLCGGTPLSAPGALRPSLPSSGAAAGARRAQGRTTRPERLCAAAARGGAGRGPTKAAVRRAADTHRHRRAGRAGGARADGTKRGHEPAVGRWEPPPPPGREGGGSGRGWMPVAAGRARHHAHRAEGHYLHQDLRRGAALPHHRLLPQEVLRSLRGHRGGGGDHRPADGQIPGIRLCKCRPSAAPRAGLRAGEGRGAVPVPLRASPKVLAPLGLPGPAPLSALTERQEGEESRRLRAARCGARSPFGHGALRGAERS